MSIAKDLTKEITKIINRPTCSHSGEVHEYCGKCGADLRVVTSYECRICSLLMKPAKVYPAVHVPDYCTQCGAPKFTFLKIKKKTASIKKV